MAMHLWWNFDFKKIKRRLGIKYRPAEYIAVPQVAEDDDDEEDRPPLMVRLTVTVTFSFTSGGLAVINAYIITTVVVGILTFWSFTKGVYKKIYLSSLEAFYLLNIIISLQTSPFKPNLSLLFLLLCIIIIPIHVYSDYYSSLMYYYLLFETVTA